MKNFKITSINDKNWCTGYILEITKKDFVVEFVRPDSDITYLATLNIKSVNKNDLKELYLGRFVKIHIHSGKIHFPFFKKLTGPEIEEAKKEAKELYEKLKNSWD